MHITAKELIANRPAWLKFLINDEGIIFSSPKLQHRDITGSSLRYKDEEGGNALAGIITGGCVEIRGHSILRVSEERVKTMWDKVLKECDSDYLRAMPMRYQGKFLYQPPAEQVAKRL